MQGFQFGQDFLAKLNFSYYFCILSCVDSAPGTCIHEISIFTDARSRKSSSNMRVSVLKIIFSTCFWIMVLASQQSFAGSCECAPSVSWQNTELLEAYTEPDPGFSSYVKPAEPFIFIMGEDNSGQDEDGSWDADFPEPGFCHDHQDEQTATTPFSWRILNLPSTPVSDFVKSVRYTLHPGGLYPPPQC